MTRLIKESVIFAVIIIFLSSTYLIYSWNKYNNEASAMAISLVESVEAFIPDEHIKELSGSSEDLGTPEYEMIKQNLTELVETANPIRFAYLMTKKDGNIVILADSEASGSEDYSHPGQLYEEAADIFSETFESGKTVITEPETDRWGTWITAIVPVMDHVSGKTIALFATDYDVSDWYVDIWDRMASDFLIVLFIFILSSALFYVRFQHLRNNELSKKLAYGEMLYSSVFDQAPVGVAIMKDKSFADQSDFAHFNINPMFEKIVGRTSSEIEQLSWTDITHPDDLEEDLEKFSQFVDGRTNGYTMEKRYIRPDNSVVWVNMKISPLTGISDRNSMHLCLIDDITAHKEAEAMLSEIERRQSVLLSHLPGLAYRCSFDRDWTMQFVSDGCYNLTGYSSDSLIHNSEISFNDIISPQYRELLWNEWNRLLKNNETFRYEYEITTAAGERKWVLEMGQGIYSDDGEVEALEGIVLDISDKKKIERNLIYLNEHDRWTGLFNRDYLEKLLEKDMAEQDMANRALISINLSTVQLLTANYGFHHTQSLIKKAAETLYKFSSDDCMLFKTFENRFVLYIKKYKDKKELIDLSEAIADELEALFVTDRVGGGIGILEMGNQDGSDIDLILKRLLIASEKPVDIYDRDFCACFYDDELEAAINREGDIRQELSRIAADENSKELYLQYQPILDVKTDSICGFEALARMKTEKLGFVSPLEFIPVAEKTKLIIPIGERVITDAFRFLKRLKAEGFYSLSVSINVSAIQLLRPEFADRLFGLIKEMGVDPDKVGIELTESIFSTDYDDINAIIRSLQSGGVHVAIDDFGTGYSSLAREKELEVNCLKIDKYFIDRLLEVGNERAITGDIISMAHKLGHCAIAEGVEYEEQKQYLKEHGCDKIQGYLVSRPLDEDSAMDILRGKIL